MEKEPLPVKFFKKKRTMDFFKPPVSGYLRG